MEPPLQEDNLTPFSLLKNSGEIDSQDNASKEETTVNTGNWKLVTNWQKKTKNQSWSNN